MASMKEIEQIRNSGLIESYAIGNIDHTQLLQIEKWLKKYPFLHQDVYEIQKALEQYAMAHSEAPSKTVKALLLTTLDYNLRLEKGEKPTFPPALHKHSTIDEFKPWLDRIDMVEPENYEAMFGKIIGATEERTTIIVWLKLGAPDETHTDEIEKFLIIEGTCNIIIGDQIHSLVAGDNISIPLHINHRVEVTSSFRCKVILERAAA